MDEKVATSTPIPIAIAKFQIWPVPKTSKSLEKHNEAVRRGGCLDMIEERQAFDTPSGAQEGSPTKLERESIRKASFRQRRAAVYERQPPGSQIRFASARGRNYWFVISRCLNSVPGRFFQHAF